MSCFIVDNESILEIVRVCKDEYTRPIKSCIISKMVSPLWEMYHDKDGNLNAQEACEDMLRMNIQAYNIRYSITDDIGSVDIKYTERLGRRSLVQIAKNLRCFLYQCSSGGKEITESRLYKALEKYGYGLLWHIVSGMDEYKNANWE